MKAVVHGSYGIEALELREVGPPEFADDAVLVRVRAASINPVDRYGVTGTPLIARPLMGLRRPKSGRVGRDFAGTVEAVGPNVTEFNAGDDVFGAADGALAEYVCEDSALARKPANASFEEAAAVPIAGVTALQGLRDHGRLDVGQHVLVNGASGGVGTFAVQIAKALGAEVTAVCSTRNVEQARTLGADHVVDYTRDDFTRTGRRFDLILDVAGSRPWRACKRVLNPNGTLVIVGGPTGRLLGPLGHIVKVRIAAARGSRNAVFFIAKLNGPDLDVLRGLIESGEVKPVVEKRYPLADAADALRHLGAGHARGKVVLTVNA